LRDRSNLDLKIIGHEPEPELGKRLSKSTIRLIFERHMSGTTLDMIFDENESGNMFHF
jgi:hypothetical protein